MFMVFSSFYFCPGVIRWAVEVYLFFSELPVPGLRNPVRRSVSKTFTKVEKVSGEEK
jgi:hypothetical protein